ncbi:Acyl-CoA synthetase (AMP-forming)/AMP-acid ligase II [Stigmatella aurantiaca]|uniref:Acyl-CoA synthetase (AMP-forming)/AMP-acid ligase II n=1 Tax=Stigmatella aurantiaca TaxID=41 RepID=A0A1H7Y4C0_STIAU|nr:AMP-binding protein [Stigmatella aurantiaca]SEM40980.1 Acyl-CoA synthetase (AMP-forming)/AMP-acid ligase II [Stigmatella aurantiaca]
MSRVAESPSLPAPFPTVVDALRHHAQHQPERLAYTFLAESGEEESKLTFAQLDAQARAIAVELQKAGAAGQRVVMLYPSCLEFVAAYFGCLYGNVVAVPAYPPEPARLQRTLPRLQAIVKNASAKKILTTQAIKSMVSFFTPYAPELGEVEWIATDAVDVNQASEYQRPNIGPQTLSFLQYTSGSTATPKGVMVTHANLVANTLALTGSVKTHKDSVLVCWLPLFHDMGLIGNVIHAAYVGFHCVLMAPTTFLQNPFLWVKAVSDYKATFTGGPNFGYELCNRKVTAEQRATLNLSSLETAYNGAEPVRYETLERFFELFGPHGLRRSALKPCYGMAETTLVVSMTSMDSTGPITMMADGSSLERNQIQPVAETHAGARRLVASGNVATDATQRVLIVRPETGVRCAANEVGEIWTSGPSVARGYWNMSDETEAIFHAYLSDTGEGPFLRTGDLGFLREDGELFITGRWKDLVIIRGTNHYPQDIERTMEQQHPAMRPGCGAAFCVDVKDEERLVVVQEVDANKVSDFDGLLEKVRSAITQNHGVQPYALVLVAPRSITKTSSGKIQRRACRSLWLSGEMEKVYEWRQPELAAETAKAPKAVQPAAAPVAKPSPAAALQAAASVTAPEESARHTATKPTPEVHAFLIARVAEEAKLAASLIDPKLPFTTYGLDSAGEIMLTKALEDFLGVKLAANLTWEYPSIDALARYLGGEDVMSVTMTEKRKLAERASR